MDISQPINDNNSPAHLALKEHLTSLSAIEAEIAPLQNKVALIEQTEEEVERAKASVGATATKRQLLLGRAYLGESIDMAVVELEMKEATELLGQLTTDTEGASAAKEIMQGQLGELRKEVAAMAIQVEPLQYAAMRERITPIAERYKKLTAQVKDAYLELIGSAQAIDDFGASSTEGRLPLAYTFNGQLSFNTMNISEFNGFKANWHLSGEQVPFKAKFMQAVRDEGIL